MLWCSKQVEHCWTAFFISAFLFNQHTDLHTSNFILPCCCYVLFCLNIYICNWDGIIICLSFTAMPSIMAKSCLMGQYLCMSCTMSSFLCGQPFIIYPLSFCRCVSLIASCMSCINVQTGRSTAVYHICIYAGTLYLFIFILFAVVWW